MAWYQPKEDDFVLKDPSRPWIGLGSLTRALITKFQEMTGPLQREYMAAINSKDDQPTQLSLSVASDERLRFYELSLQRLNHRFNLPVTLQESFLLLAMAQRVFLEYTARYNWVTTYKLRMSQRLVIYPREDVVGAFTDDYNIADVLFYAGIPVWHVHPIKDLPKLRIAIAREPVAITATSLILPAPNSYSPCTIVDTADADPPHPVVFKGMSTDLGRYLAMAAFLRSQSSTGLMGPPSILSASSISSKPEASGGGRSSVSSKLDTSGSGRSRTSKSSQQRKKLPCK